MEERKVPEEERKDSEEEYSFLQEVIKDETGGKRLRSRILHMIALGSVFGIVTCFSFSVSKPWIESKLGRDPEQITIPKDEEKKETDGEENAEDGAETAKKDTSAQPDAPAPEEKTAPDSESYRQMLQSLKEVAKDSADSIVEITGLEEKDVWKDELRDSRQSISGVIVADNGQELLILGKICPVKNAKHIRVTFSGGDSYDASVKASDRNLGLSVYAVARSGIAEETRAKINTAALGNSNLVNIGDTVIVYGKPFGYSNAYTYGIISTERANINLSDGQYEAVYTDISGTDGASGVLMNIRGEVIAIVDQTLLEEDSRSQIAGYGISDIKDVIELMSNGQSVPYIGIRGVDVTEDMESQGLPKGVYVKTVETDSPAMAAGIQNGDIITAVDDAEVVDIAGYHKLLMRRAQGNKIVFKGCRQGTGGEYVDINFSVTVGTKK